MGEKPLKCLQYSFSALKNIILAIFIGYIKKKTKNYTTRRKQTETKDKDKIKKNKAK